MCTLFVSVDGACMCTLCACACARTCMCVHKTVCIKPLNFILIKQAEGVVNSGQRKQVTVGSTQKEQVMVDSRQEEEQVTEGHSQKVCHSTYRYKIKYLNSGCKKAKKKV